MNVAGVFVVEDLRDRVSLEELGVFSEYVDRRDTLAIVVEVLVENVDACSDDRHMRLGLEDERLALLVDDEAVMLMCVVDRNCFVFRERRDPVLAKFDCLDAFRALDLLAHICEVLRSVIAPHCSQRS